MRCALHAVCATFVLNREKNRNRPCEVGVHPGREGAGNLLLLAAAHTAGLVTTLTTAVSASRPPDGSRLTHLRLESLQLLLLTLLFLGAVGLRRTWDGTELHRRCSSLVDGTPPSVWVPTCRAAPFPGRHNGWGRSAHRCARRLHNLPVVDHRSRSVKA